MSELTLTTVAGGDDLEIVRTLCWSYRDFLLTLGPRDREIIEIFYPKTEYQRLMAQLPQLHARPKGIMLLAKDAQDVALGCGMSHALDDQTSEIKRVFVTENARGRGIAATLCTALVDQARSDEFARVVLDTSKSLAAAQRLYDRLGFVRRGPYQPIPDDVLPHLLFFEKIL